MNEMNFPDIKYLYRESSKIVFCVNNEKVYMTNHCKGSYTIGPSSEKYIADIMKNVINCLNDGQDIQFAFLELGSINTLRLLQAICLKKFLNYFQIKSHAFCSRPFSGSYYNLLYEIFGIKTQLNNTSNLVICSEMERIYKMFSKNFSIMILRQFQKLTGLKA